MKTRNLLLILGVSVATMGTLENTGPIKKDCEIYQGYTNGFDQRTLYVFDSLPYYKRDSLPRHIIGGGPELRNSLLEEEAIGKRFCFTYMEPMFPFGGKIIKTLSQTNGVITNLESSYSE